MPLRETEAIVLRTYRLGEADKIAALFTRQLGRLRAVATGAQRPKGRYGGVLEPLSYLRIWIFERENRDLLRLNSAELLESFFEMQKDYRIQIAAQYVVEVTERMMPEREVNERAFRLLLAVLRGVKRTGEVNRPLLYFNYWMLRLGGILPDLEHCASCGRSLEAEGYYGPGAEGLWCTGCRSGEAAYPTVQGGASLTVSREALAMAQQACQGPLDPWLAAEKAPPGVRQARRFFEEVIESHLERKLVTRALLAEET
jgi:DNA repair protein RecO (recombination protein O)